MTTLVIRQRSYFGWPESPADPVQPRKGVVIHYNGRATDLGPHEDCVAYWQRVRTHHMVGNGWVDIGYSFGVCRHGETFVGRGLDRYQAAQGTTEGNTDYYSISLMLGGLETPTDDQVAAVREFRAHLISEYGVAPVLLPHSQFFDTECPGPVVQELIRQGVFD